MTDILVRPDPEPRVEPEFMRVARSLAVQESRSLRCYARMGVTYLPGRTRAGWLDEALEVVALERSVRRYWAGVLPRRDAAPDASVA